MANDNLHSQTTDGVGEPGGTQTSSSASLLLAFSLTLSGVLTLLVVNALVPYLHTYLSAGLLLTALLLSVLMLRLLRRDLFKPLRELQQWALKIRGGTLSARLACPPGSDFGELAEDINFIGQMFESLAREADEQLAEHTRHITEKTRSLAVLYDVAASINVARDLDDLLTRFLHTLTDIVGASAAAVRLTDNDDSMRLVASIGLSETAVERERVPPAATCICHEAASSAGILVQRSMSECQARIGCDFFAAATDDEMAMLIVPLQYRDRTLGAYNLYVPQVNLQSMQELKELFISIGRHLGMAIEKARLDKEAQFLSIVEERTSIASELHDSLAQTLVSIGFQVRILKEVLEQKDAADWTPQMQRIERTLEDANREVRNLIAHFRGSIDRHGLLPSIKQAVDKFRVDSGMQIFLQEEWPDRELPANCEIQVLRVIQEALSNIRRHSQANTVRVMLSGDKHGYRVLIEDDGIGIETDEAAAQEDEHFGLQILHERAKRIGGALSIESEPGEGTRVVLTFNYPEPEPGDRLHVDLRHTEYEVARSHH